MPLFQGVFQDESGPVVEVPAKIIAALGSEKRPPVRVVINGVEFRTTIAVYGGHFYIGVRRDLRQAAGLEPGDVVEVSLERDEQPRTVELPDDLAEALAEDPEASQAFDRLSFTNRKEYVSWIVNAKRADTRHRRVAEAPALLRSGRRTPA